MTVDQRDVIVREGPFTRAERDALPDDGRSHELLDGVLVMTPAPTWRHQAVVVNLLRLLDQRLPGDLRLSLAPTDVTLAGATVIQPDVLVARASAVEEDHLVGPPLLAIEVLSPSTRSFDLGTKKDLLEAAGCPSYWVVDPAVPSLTAWHLVDGRFVEVAQVTGSQAWTSEQPYAVRVVPSALLAE